MTPKQILKIFAIALLGAVLVGCDWNGEESLAGVAEGAPLVEGASAAHPEIGYFSVGLSTSVNLRFRPNDRRNSITTVTVTNPVPGGAQPSVTLSGQLTWQPNDADFNGVEALVIEMHLARGPAVIFNLPVDVRKSRIVTSQNLVANDATYSDAEGEYLVQVSPKTDVGSISGTLQIVEDYDRAGLSGARYFFGDAAGDGGAILKVLKAPLRVAQDTNGVSNRARLRSRTASSSSETSWPLRDLAAAAGIPSRLGSVTPDDVYTTRASFYYDSVPSGYIDPVSGMWVARQESRYTESKNINQYLGSCGDTILSGCLANGKVPIILVHGFTPECINDAGYLGCAISWVSDPLDSGGAGTWGDLAQSLVDNGNPTFEMRWYTQMRFEEAAGRLIEFARWVARSTGRKPVILAHSFGGIVGHLVIQNKGITWDARVGKWVANSVDSASVVEKLVTLNSPLSGIQAYDNYVDAELTVGRDAEDWTIDRCSSLTCLQAGSQAFADSTDFAGLLKVDPMRGALIAGETIKSLQKGLKDGVERVPSLTVVGIKRRVGEAVRGVGSWDESWHLGDGLISIFGQALIPTDFASNPFGDPTVGPAGYSLPRDLHESLARISPPGECVPHGASGRDYLICVRATHTTKQSENGGILNGFGDVDYPIARYTTNLVTINNPRIQGVHPLKKILFDGYGGTSAPHIGIATMSASVYPLDFWPQAKYHGAVISSAAAAGSARALASIPVTQALVWAVVSDKNSGETHLSLDLVATDSRGEFNTDLGQYIHDAFGADSALENFSVSLHIYALGLPTWERRFENIDSDTDLGTIDLTATSGLVDFSGQIIDAQTDSTALPFAKVWLTLGVGKSEAQIRLEAGALGASNVSRQVIADGDGHFSIDGLRPGVYSVLLEAAGYLSQVVSEIRIDGLSEAQLGMLRILGAEEGAITLRWAGIGDGNQVASDLDSHLKRFLSTGQLDYHIYYAAPSVVGIFDSLDRDDTTFEGPETIVFGYDRSRRYTYFVHNFTGGITTIRDSKPQVTLRLNGSAQTFEAPAVLGVLGRYWRVFDIIEGRVVRCTIDCITDVMP